MLSLVRMSQRLHFSLDDRFCCIIVSIYLSLGDTQSTHIESAGHQPCPPIQRYPSRACRRIGEAGEGEINMERICLLLQGVPAIQLQCLPEQQFGERNQLEIGEGAMGEGNALHL